MRGMDGSGIYMVPHDKEEDVALLKSALAGPDFVESSSYATLTANTEDYGFIIGHNRAKTAGKARAKNSHPFSIGNITLVHNGTIRNSHMLYTGAGHFPVDSEALCYALNEHGAEAVLPKIQGSYAIIWHDKSTGNLYMARNDERPLHFGVSEDKNSIYIASELDHLQWLTGRITGIEVNEYFWLPTNEIFEFPAGDVCSYKSIAKLRAPNKALPKPVNNSAARAWNNHYAQQYTKDDWEVSLKRFGYAAGGSIIFTPIEFTSYGRGNNRGSMRCITRQPLVEVLLHSVPADEAARMITNTKKERFMGKINFGRERYNGEVTISVQHNSVTTISKKREKKENVILLFPGPNSTEIPAQAFNKLVAFGCTWCAADIDEFDSGDILYIPQEQGGGVLCGECIRRVNPVHKDNMIIDVPFEKVN